MIIKDNSLQVRQLKKHIKLNIPEFKVALQETKTMSADIALNGTSGYKTLDDLLNED